MIDGLLDTNVVIDLLRQVARTFNWYEALDQQRLGIVPIVWMEVVQGAQNKSEQRQLIRFLNRFQMEHPTPEDNQWAMQQLAHFYLSHGIHFQDTLIAATAARLRVPIYTFNTRHFSPLPDVRVLRPY